MCMTNAASCSSDVIKGDGKEIPEVVKRWVEHYERNQKSAMAELLTMLFEVYYMLCPNHSFYDQISSLCSTT